MFIIFILMPIFFMYILPILLLFGEERIYTTAWFATLLLIVGIILWAVKHLLILRMIRLPRRLQKLHQKVQQTGRPAQAKILRSIRRYEYDSEPEILTEIEFENLASSKVKAILSVTDTKKDEGRFEEGKTIDLMLNQQGFSPAFTVAGAQYQKGSRLFLWIFLIFDIAYAIVLFLFSYHLESQGMGWRFLTPLHPWIIGAVMGIIVINLLSKFLGLMDDPTQNSAYEYLSTKKPEEVNQLLLHGRSTVGEVLKYSRTGYSENDQPQIQFFIQYENEYGDLVKANHKQIVDLVDLHSLKPGIIEVVYLPSESNRYMFNYV